MIHRCDKYSEECEVKNPQDAPAVDRLIVGGEGGWFLGNNRGLQRVFFCPWCGLHLDDMLIPSHKE